MTVNITTVPKETTTSAPGHGCCGSAAAAEPQSKASKPANPGPVERAKPSPAVELCCCGGAGKK